MPSRRQFVGSVGAGLLLAPFINMGLAPRGAGRHQAVQAPADLRHHGDLPAALDADGVGRDDHLLERDDAAAVGGGEQRGPRRGDAERQPQRRPRQLRQPHRPGVRLLRREQRPGHQDLRRSIRGQEPGRRRDQPPDRLAAAGRQRQRERRPLPVLRRLQRREPPDDQLAAVGLQHRVRHGAADRDVGLDAAHPSAEHPRHHLGRDQIARGDPRQQREGQARRPPRLDLAAREQAERQHVVVGRRLHQAGDAGGRQQLPGHERPRRAGGQPDPPADHRQRLRLRHHPGGLPRVRQRSEADGQRAVQLQPPLRRSTRRLHPQRRRLELREPGEVRGLPGDPVRQPHQRAEGDQGPARFDRSVDAVRQHAHGLGARHGRRAEPQSAVDALRSRQRQRRLPQARQRRALRQIDRAARAHPAQHLRRLRDHQLHRLRRPRSLPSKTPLPNIAA